jgi:hypothetical protein
VVDNNHDSEFGQKKPSYWLHKEQREVIRWTWIGSLDQYRPAETQLWLHLRVKLD